MVEQYYLTAEQPDIESSTPDYATRFSGDTGEWFLSIQCHALKSAISNTDNKKHKILDVGGGHGQDVEVITSEGHSLTILGSDESCAQMIRNELLKGLVSFDQGSLLEMPYKDDEFEICVSFRMLPHLERWQDHIAELCRVSKKKVVVDFPTKRSVNIFSDLFFSLKKGIEKNTRPYKLFSEQEIIHVFQQNGFELHQRKPEFFFPMALHRALKNVHISRFIEGIANITGLRYFFGSPLICTFTKVDT